MTTALKAAAPIGSWHDADAQYLAENQKLLAAFLECLHYLKSCSPASELKVVSTPARNADSVVVMQFAQTGNQPKVLISMLVDEYAAGDQQKFTLSFESATAGSSQPNQSLADFGATLLQIYSTATGDKNVKQTTRNNNATQINLTGYDALLQFSQLCLTAVEITKMDGNNCVAQRISNGQYEACNIILTINPDAKEAFNKAAADGVLPVLAAVQDGTVQRPTSRQPYTADYRIAYTSPVTPARLAELNGATPLSTKSAGGSALEEDDAPDAHKVVRQVITNTLG